MAKRFSEPRVVVLHVTLRGREMCFVWNRRNYSSLDASKFASLASAGDRVPILVFEPIPGGRNYWTRHDWHIQKARHEDKTSVYHHPRDAMFREDKGSSLEAAWFRHGTYLIIAGFKPI